MSNWGVHFAFVQSPLIFLLSAVSGETVFAKKRGIQTLPDTCVLLLSAVTILYARNYRPNIR
jgi:hypothetical protein